MLNPVFLLKTVNDFVPIYYLTIQVFMFRFSMILYAEYWKFEI